MNAAGYRELLDFAVEVAWRAGRSTLAHYQVAVATEAKNDGSPVTVADREAEGLARRLIRRRFPADGLLGEEQGDDRPEAPRRWVIDPIDGTRTFVRGVPFFGTLLALLEHGEPVLGVAYFPALDETVAAARGEGCWWNGRRATVSTVATLERALVLATDAESIARHGKAAGWDRLRARAGMVRTWGDCYGHALVATGRAEVMLDPVVAPWDVLPFVPILAEAGGVLSAWTVPNRPGPQALGAVTDEPPPPRSEPAGVTAPAGAGAAGATVPLLRSAVATNAALARQVRELLEERG